MKLTSRIQALIAVGAAVSTNCQPCLQCAVETAVESGADVHEIAQAIEVGKRVRKGAIASMDKFAAELSSAVSSPIPIPDRDCGCGLL